MASTLATDFGSCPCGGGQFESREVEVRMTVGGVVYVMTGVPRGSCPHCGSRVYKAAVLEEIEAIMHDRPAPLPRQWL